MLRVLPRRRLLATLVALLLGAVALTGCTVQTVGRGTRGSTAPSASASASPSPSTPGVPKIDFSDCTKLVDPQGAGVPADRARNLTISCGKAAVPLDYDNPNAGTVSLYVLKIHDDTGHGQQPLVVNPGGPGGSSVSLAVGLAGQVSADLLQHYDLIGLDPRGVGLSSPVTCLDDKEKDSVFAAAPDVRTPQGLAQAQQIAQTWVQGCQGAAGSALGDYNTVYTARDMDLVRQALGGGKLDYLGFSYGTQLGATYATMFPGSIDRMVLDGAIDPGQSYAVKSETQTAGFELAFDQFASDCVTKPACAAMGNPANAVTQLAAQAAASGGIPVSTAGETRKATAGIVYTAVAEALYDQSEWSTMAEAVIAGQKGDGKQLLALADQYDQRDSQGHYTNLLDAFQIVSCNDGGVTYSDADLTAFGNDWAVKYPVFGAYFAGQMAMCNGWPQSAHPAPTEVPAPGAPPIVVVGTVHDPATPYANAGALANSLGPGVGTLLSWDGQGHTAYLKSDCIDKAVDAYLLAGTLPAANTTCPAK